MQHVGVVLIYYIEWLTLNIGLKVSSNIVQYLTSTRDDWHFFYGDIRAWDSHVVRIDDQAPQYRDETVISLGSAPLKFLSLRMLRRACLAVMLLVRKDEWRLFKILLQNHVV